MSPLLSPPSPHRRPTKSSLVHGNFLLHVGGSKRGEKSPSPFWVCPNPNPTRLRPPRKEGNAATLQIDGVSGDNLSFTADLVFPSSSSSPGQVNAPPKRAQLAPADGTSRRRQDSPYHAFPAGRMTLGVGCTGRRSGAWAGHACHVRRTRGQEGDARFFPFLPFSSAQQGQAGYSVQDYKIA